MLCLYKVYSFPYIAATQIFYHETSTDQSVTIHRKQETLCKSHAS